MTTDWPLLRYGCSQQNGGQISKYFLQPWRDDCGVLWKCEYDNIVLAINGANEVKLMDNNIVDTKTTLNFMLAFIS